MIVLERIAPHNLLLFQSIRLRALRQDPQAFGSTYERESKFTFHDWVQRVNRWNGETGIGILAIEKDTGETCGLAGGLLDDGDASRAQLVSMWTAPECRKQGVGRLLVHGVQEWARERGVPALHLMVTSNNDNAIAFYRRLGFSPTGCRGPYPNDPALEELEMVLALG